MGVVGSGDVEIAAADVIDCVIIHKEGTVGILDGAVGRKNGIVRLNNSSGNTRSWIDCKFEF